MARFNNRLDHVRVAAPCKADWDQMIGDERVRFCGQCSLNVYNLSSMSRSDAESLIARNEGRLCVRFYRRHDGSIITRDCPIGLRAIRRRLSYVARAVSSSVLGLLAGLGVYGVVSSLTPIAPQRTMGVMARDIVPPRVATVGQMVSPVNQRTPGFKMGKMLVKPIRHSAASGQNRNGSSNR
jgi:hypothetical protein